MTTVKELLVDAEDRMKKSVATLQHHFSTVRSGKANIHMLDEIMVDYYGTPTPLKNVSSVTTPEAQLIVVQPWEKQLIGEIMKAIQKSNLGFNPLSDGQVVRVPVPSLNEERRKELVKLVKKMAEDDKVAIRNVRRDTLDHVKRLLKDHKISEDEKDNAEIDVQKITDKYIEQIDKLTSVKEAEVMAV